MLHAVLLLATQWHGFAGAPQGVTLSPDFYNRETETQLLQEWVFSTSAEIMVLLGPRNCGKTALMKHALMGLQEEGCIGLSYIDTRQVVWWVLMPKEGRYHVRHKCGGPGLSFRSNFSLSAGAKFHRLQFSQEALSVRQTWAASPYAAGGALASFS